MFLGSEVAMAFGYRLISIAVAPRLFETSRTALESTRAFRPAGVNPSQGNARLCSVVTPEATQRGRFSGVTGGKRRFQRWVCTHGRGILFHEPSLAVAFIFLTPERM